MSHRPREKSQKALDFIVQKKSYNENKGKRRRGSIAKVKNVGITVKQNPSLVPIRSALVDAG